MKKLKSKVLVSRHSQRSRIQNRETAFNLTMYEQFANGLTSETETDAERDYQEVQDSLLIPNRVSQQRKLD